MERINIHSANATQLSFRVHFIPLLWRMQFFSRSFCLVHHPLRAKTSVSSSSCLQMQDEAQYLRAKLPLFKRWKKILTGLWWKELEHFHWSNCNATSWLISWNQIKPHPIFKNQIIVLKLLPAVKSSNNVKARKYPWAKWECFFLFY